MLNHFCVIVVRNEFQLETESYICLQYTTQCTRNKARFNNIVYSIAIFSLCNFCCLSIARGSTIAIQTIHITNSNITPPQQKPLRRNTSSSQLAKEFVYLLFCLCIHCNSRFFTACTFTMYLFLQEIIASSNKIMRIALHEVYKSCTCTVWKMK